MSGKTYHPLHVLQYNTGRSRDQVMVTLLREPRTLEADIIAVQEPWENEYEDVTHHPANRSHQLVYPRQADTGARARVCMYVSRKINPVSWQHKAVSRDYHYIRIQYRRHSQRHLRTITIHNVYNVRGSDTLQLMRQTIREAQSRYDDHIILGDMNLHHPTWGGAHHL